jgi:amidase
LNAGICHLTATEQVRLLRSKQLSAREVMEVHLEQIARINPQVNAIVTLAEDQARSLALAADEAAARGEFLGLLHGLPVAHKDLAETRGMRTTFGSPIFQDYVPDFSTLLVERTQRAGAITSGKPILLNSALGRRLSIPSLDPRAIPGTFRRPAADRAVARPSRSLAACFP